ncbi:beta-glucosidase BglX [Salinimicrobium sp. MT39]|uniref:beta-glucosidase n=2 Tax=Salinimicrobium profundisediminis TaxID=2994553 RepID=A0A9X3HZD2_9FLAO|nr:beta-glucosidase BglX [Salinimicrobium profundisediminis]MCX2836601.1 beta-glucosidase BglX [Salinimicrobium profundisediminis]
MTSTALLLVSVLILTGFSIKQDRNMKLNSQPNDSIEAKIDSLLSIMTLEEKAGQMNQYNGFWEVTGPAPKDGDAALKYEHLRNGRVGSMLTVRGVDQVRAVQEIVVNESRLGIPLIIGFDVIHGYKTLSPIPLAEAASWDMEAIRRSAEVGAAEAAASGINWTFAPMVDVSRDARWGRVMEGGGEDPYLGSKIAAARVKGFQGDDLSNPLTVAATAKHFAGYGFAEAGREYNKADIGMSTLYNMILPPFKAAEEAGVRTFMTGFNTLDEIPVTGNEFLLRDILKGKWGFDGFVISDYASIEEMVVHGFVKNEKMAAKKAVEAGVDMDMEAYSYVNEIVGLVNEGKLDESLVDDAVRRILRVKYELGLMDDPYRYLDAQREKEVVGSSSHHEAVLDMAKKSIVLLKNEGNLLPLKKNGQKIALIGDLADDKNSPLGSWRIASDDNTAISVLEGMQQYKGNKLTFEQGAQLVVGAESFLTEVRFNTTDKSGFPAAVKAARNADVVVMVLGEHGFQSGEGRSRTNLDFPGVQQELLEEVFAANKNVVLVLNNGRPLAIDWAAKNIPAIVEAWQLGTQTGNAVAQVLYGHYNPSGKLPMTFPRNIGQTPIYYNHQNTGRPEDPNPGADMVWWSHYMDVENTPLYPFGYGLSYTTFKYDNLKLNKEQFEMGGEVQVSVDVANTGNYDGKEVVQLYIRDLYGSTVRPVRELKGFELVDLKKGEKRTVNFTLTEAELGFFNNQGEYVVEPGEFEVFVGGNSVETLKASFMLGKE